CKNREEDRHQVEKDRAESSEESAAVQIEQDPLTRDSRREAARVGLAIGSGERCRRRPGHDFWRAWTPAQHVRAGERAAGSLHDELAFACPDRLERNA